MNEDDLGKKLDTITTILKLAHADAIARTREAVRSEPGKAAILDATSDWTGAGPLVKTVTKKSGKAGRSVNRYIAELVELGVLEKQGGGPTTQYRSTGLI